MSRSAATGTTLSRLGIFPIGLAIGDVLGHNITSASVMGQVRNLLRAYAIEADDPAEVLRRTGAALACALPEAMVTAAYAKPSSTRRLAS